VIQGTAPPPSSDTAEHPVLNRTDEAPASALPSDEGPGPVVKAPAKSSERLPREVASLMERIKANPANANLYLQLANIYKKGDQFIKAKDILKQGLQATSNSFDLAQELLDVEIEPFRRDLGIAEERLRKKPGDSELQHIRNSLAKEVNSRELEMHRQRSDRYPTDTGARFEMGLRLLRAGQLDEAIKELQSVRSDPRHLGRATFYLGVCFKTRKNWRLAQRNFEEALEHLPPAEDEMRKEAMFFLAAGFADAGEIDRAIDLGCELANMDYNYKNIGALLDVWQAKAAK
jgi:tetratricopeptide (TPR) repeat protein